MGSHDERSSAAIIGGGISGLTAGFLLQQKGFSISVLEKEDYPGGLIQSIGENDWLVEQGPNTLMAKSEQLWDLIEQLDLEDEIVEPGKEGAKRYIVKNGIPEALPNSLWKFIRSNLLSAGAKFRLFKEPFIAKTEQPESVADFFERRLGKEVVDYAVNPFIAGIYAGDPKKLSIKHTFPKVFEFEQEYGSIVKGAIKSARGSKSNSKKNRKKGLISFKKGIQQLPRHLRQQLGTAVKFASPATRIRFENEGWEVQINEETTRSFDALIYSAPLHQLPAIAFNIEKPGLLEQLGSIRYAPIATISLGFRHRQVHHPIDGFGMLVPEVEPFNILGCLFSSSLFEGRAPDGHALLTCFVGGERNPELVGLPDHELKEMVLQDLTQLLGCSGDPVFESIHRWNKAIPQYEMDYQNHLDAMNELEEQNPGLFFTGNFRKDVSVPGCIENAYETADRAASFLQS